MRLNCSIRRRSPRCLLPRLHDQRGQKHLARSRQCCLSWSAAYIGRLRIERIPSASFHSFQASDWERFGRSGCPSCRYSLAAGCWDIRAAVRPILVDSFLARIPVCLAATLPPELWPPTTQEAPGRRAYTVIFFSSFPPAFELAAW